MELQRLRITEDKRVFLDDFEIRNVRGLELKACACCASELTLELDVSLEKVGEADEPVL